MRINEWLAGGFGALLIFSLFLDWYSGANAWDWLAATDVILAVAGIFGIALLAGTATQRTPAVQQSVAALTVPVAFVGSILAVIHLLSVPDGAHSRDAGVWIGTLAVLGLMVSAWRSMGDQRFPAAVTPQLDIPTLPAPARGGERSADE